MILDIACITNAGGRSVNQDCVGYANANNTWCLIVADGVGGYIHGEYASQLAVQYIKESFLSEPKVEEKILKLHMEAATRRISDIINANPTLNSMRTTLAVLYMNDKKIVGGYIGDSRIYILSNNEIFYYSKDHSLVMQMALRGEFHMNEIRGHPKRNVITSAIGKDFPKKMDTVSFNMSVSCTDGILLCSDGFWELVTEDEMLRVFAESTTSEMWLAGMEQLVGNRQSGRSDNYTCLAARVAALE